MQSSSSEPQKLLREVEEMMDHFSKYPQWTSVYWKTYARLIFLQVKFFHGDVLSPNSYWAGTFSGAPRNGIKLVAEELSAGFWSLFWTKMTGALRRLSAVDFVPSWFLRLLWGFIFRRGLRRWYTNVAGANYERLVQYGYELFRTPIVEHHLWSPAIYGVDLVDVGDGQLAFQTVRDVNNYLLINDLMSRNTSFVIEIGAGIGELARLFLKTGRVQKYVIVDIPPVLAFSQRLLREEFGAQRISPFLLSRSELESGKLCYFLTPDQLETIPDLRGAIGINVASFGEMSPDIVGRYIECLKRKGVSEFVSINHRIGKPNNPDAIGEKEYEKFFGTDYQVAKRGSFSENKPNLQLRPDLPDTPGYQLLHFVKNLTGDQKRQGRIVARDGASEPVSACQPRRTGMLSLKPRR